MNETTRKAPAQAWARHDAVVLAGLAGVAAVAIVLGTLGATRLQEEAVWKMVAFGLGTLFPRLVDHAMNDYRRQVEGVNPRTS